jgi:hypothetical protein
LGALGPVVAEIGSVVVETWPFAFPFFSPSTLILSPRDVFSARIAQFAGAFSETFNG